jgi:glutathione peroxidase
MKLWTATLITIGFFVLVGPSCADNPDDKSSSENAATGADMGDHANHSDPDSGADAAAHSPDTAQPTPDQGAAPDMASPGPDTSTPDDQGTMNAQGVHAFTVSYIDGFEVNLSEYAGKVLLIVNVASKCGFTPQYETLEQLYQQRKDEGFEILAFPANNFNMQEPGSNEEIADFCDEEYGITFPLFSKISVKGADKHPLYEYLTGEHGEVQWNFNKFLIDKDGLAVARYNSSVEPMSTDLGDAITAELAR